MYSDVNFKTKKAFKTAVDSGIRVALFQPGPFGGGDYSNGKFCVEGPHFPEPHRWYAQVEVKDGFVVRVK